MILDIMFPKLKGLKLPTSAQYRFTISYFNAVREIFRRGQGIGPFKGGADDYLTKPFHLPELLLRVKGILRRWEWYKEPGL
ncbi:MAG: hypothetical protein Ct9H300mP23_00790 [Nitrospinota bacterium]|nr:MAG: hypothetical protein Ct9H300mP23_00790 [Nitrospinota bacterium]